MYFLTLFFLGTLLGVLLFKDDEVNEIVEVGKLGILLLLIKRDEEGGGEVRGDSFTSSFTISFDSLLSTLLTSTLFFTLFFTLFKYDKKYYLTFFFLN